MMGGEARKPQQEGNGLWFNFYITSFNDRVESKKV